VQKTRLFLSLKFLSTLDPVDVRYTMVATARWQFRTKNVENAFRIREKVSSRFDNEAVRMVRPRTDQPLVDERCFARRFEAERILAVIAFLLSRCSQVDDRIVPAQLVVERRSHGTPQIIGARPIGGAIDGAAIAQHDGGVHSLRRGFELSLYVEDRPLGRPQGVALGRARKSTAEHDAGRFVQDVDVFAKMLTNQFEDRGLTGAGTSREDDPCVSVWFSTLAG
jgi:hypothetical protein